MGHIEYTQKEDGFLMICRHCGRIEGLYSRDEGEIERRKREFKKRHRTCKAKEEGQMLTDHTG